MSIQDTFEEVLHVVATDWRPSRVESREAVRKAVMAAAREHGGRVHAATVREHLPTWVASAQIGAVILRLVRRGYLVETGKYAPNGKRGKARNAAKQSRIRRLVRPIPPEGVQP